MKKALISVLLASLLWMEACAVPAWISAVEQDAEVAAPIAASLVTVIDPSLAPLVTAIETGFNALVKTLDAYKAQPSATNLQAVEAAFTAVNNNVTQLESAAQIKNAATQSTVTAVVELLTQAVTEIAAQVPASVRRDLANAAQNNSASGSAAVRNPRAATAKGWTAGDLKREYNNIIKGDSRFQPLP